MPMVANDTEDPTRVFQRKLYRAAKRSRTRRFHALYDKFHRRDMLERAWREVATNGGAAGVDGETIEAVRTRGEAEFLTGLETELREERYRPLAVRRVSIPKPAGGQRLLGVPAVRDRVAQAALKLVIEPVFEADFCDCSYGFRPKRSTQQARERVREGMQREQRLFVVETDIKGLFDNLDRDLLLRFVRERISDRRVVALIQRWLRAGVLADGTLLHPTVGTPQGGVISPLLANIYLHRLDRGWQERYAKLGRMIRYADDLVVLCWRPDQARQSLDALEKLASMLELELAAAKTGIVNLEEEGQGMDFLGFHFRWIPSRRDPSRHYAACWPSRRAMAAARQRIRELTSYDRIGRPAIMVVEELNRFLRGWGAYFRWGNSTQQFKALDAYVVERVSRFLSRKHGKGGRTLGLAKLLESSTRLGLYRLAGTVRYPSAHASR